MLSKVSNATVSGQGVITATKTADSKPISSTSTNTIVPEFSVNNLVGYKFDCIISPVYKGGNLPYIFTFLNGSTTLTTKTISGKGDLTYSTGDIEGPNSNVSLSLTCRINTSSSYTGEIKNGVLTYYYFGTISIHKLGGINGKPRSLKSISEKANITIFGVHTDNERIEDFKGALSTNFEYVASKGEAHKTTSVSTTYYTAIGYGYCRYDVKSNGNEGYVKLNGIKLGYVSESGAHLINLIFFKPGDILEFNLLYSLELVDYY